MDRSNDWTRLQRHFEALCDLLPTEQSETLQALNLPPEQAAELKALLDADRPDARMTDLADVVNQVTRSLSGADLGGQQIGPYRLLHVIGMGGMGDVFLAERSDGRFEARVAVKFVAGNSGHQQSLFERERQILARLNHPAIARIIDAGEHERHGPYLVMEYVDGDSIDVACRAAGGDPERVLSWLIEAADAVAFAHQNLVLHRDLKPAHLMIDRDGQVKILDFGVAGLLSEGASDGHATVQSSFTPRYAAPEQILNQPASTRTDVYALGLLLFELLADGASAFGDREDRMSERKLADQRASTPVVSAWSRSRQRDLRAILGRSLARNPQDRYASPADFAADLRALLSDQAVTARTARWWETGMRWLRQHRIAGAALTLTGLTVLVGTLMVFWYAQVAQNERYLALQEAAKAQATADFLADLFSGSTPGQSQGPETTALTLLERGQERIGQELSDQPETRAYLELVMARSYLFLGLYDDALEMLASDSPDMSMDVRHDRRLLAARLLAFKGEYQAMSDLLDGLDLSDYPNEKRARAEVLRATARINLNDIEGASAAAEEAVRWTDETDEGLEQRASAENMLAIIAYNKREYVQARAAFERLLATRRQRFGEDHAETALAIHNLAGVSYAQGDLRDALGYYQRASELFERHYGVENRSFAMVQRALGMTYRKLGDADQAMRQFDCALTAVERWSGTHSSFWREILMQKIELAILLGRDRQALEWLRQFGRLDQQDWQGREANACRWARMRSAVGLQEDVVRWCAELGPEPAHLQAGQEYLRARMAWAQGDASYEQHQRDAVDALANLSPPDPLLEAAIRRLEVP